jgi:hypothetical protein
VLDGLNPEFIADKRRAVSGFDPAGLDGRFQVSEVRPAEHDPSAVRRFQDKMDALPRMDADTLEADFFPDRFLFDHIETVI